MDVCPKLLQSCFSFYCYRGTLLEVPKGLFHDAENVCELVVQVHQVLTRYVWAGRTKIWKK